MVPAYGVLTVTCALATQTTVNSTGNPQAAIRSLLGGVLFSPVHKKQRQKYSVDVDTIVLVEKHAVDDSYSVTVYTAYPQRSAIVMLNVSEAEADAQIACIEKMKDRSQIPQESLAPDL